MDRIPAVASRSASDGYDRRVSSTAQGAPTDLRTAVFGPDPAAVGPARALVRDAVREWGAQAVLDDAVLIASELVTNAIVHPGTAAEVSCSLVRDESGHGTAVRVEVA